MEVNREELVTTLSRLKPALRGGSSMPSFANVWFDGKTVTAYDGGLGLRVKFTSDLECGVPGAALLGLLSTSVLETVSLEVASKGVCVKLGRSTSKLTSSELDSQIWPFPEKLPKKGVVTVKLGEDFIEALRKVLFIKASTPTRVEHHGVTVEGEEDKLFLYTTDSVTLASTFVEVEGSPSKFLLPRGFAEQIVSQASGGVELSVLPSCIIAKGEDVTFYSNLIDTSGADDLGQVVASQQEKHSRRIPLPPGFEGALARAEVLSGREDAVVVLEAAGDVLTVSGNYVLGELEERLDLNQKHPTVKFRGNAKQIRRALVNAESFSLTTGSLILQGEPNFLYITSAVL